MQFDAVLIACFVIAGLVDIVVPLVLAVFLARRYQGRWRHWLIGVLTFVVFQGILRIPVMAAVQSLPAVRETLREPAWLWAFLALASVTAGLFEEGGRWLAYRYFVPAEQRHWRAGLMMGAGHGGIESIGIGVLVCASLASYLAGALPPEQFAELPGWLPLLGAWERLGALLIHLALSVIVLQAFLRGPRWWWYALAAHTLVNFTTTGLLQVGTNWWGLTAAMLATEALVTVYALLALWIIRRLRDEPPTAPGDALEAPAAPSELRI